MLRLVGVVLACAGMLLVAAEADAAEQRIALVIGNGTYEVLRPQLTNPAKDARDMGAALTAAGFDTTVRTNVKRRELYQLINDFGRKIGGSPDAVGLFYYAGHGIQSGGRNYLVPVDADVQSDTDLEVEAVDADKVLRAMDEARNRVNILILDACRDNPLPKGRSLVRGLAAMSSGTQGTFIGYAAAPGQTAQDGAAGQNGVFTGVLLQQLAEPGTIEDVFKRVIAGVQEHTGGKQLPWMESSLQGSFYFVPPSAVATVAPAAPVPAPTADTEIIFWQSIMSSRNADDFDEYLRQYPQGRFAGLARNRIALLRAPPAPPKAEPVPAAAPPPPPPAAPTASAEEELGFWKATIGGNTVANFEDYLRRYPQGRFADIARYQIAALQQAAAPAAPPAVPPVAAAPAPLSAVPAPLAAVPPSHDIARHANLCGRSVDYSVDQAGSNTPSDGFLGAWTGTWNNATGICGALIVSRIYHDYSAELVYIYGPSRHAASIEWKQQRVVGTISGNVLSFRDERGNTFAFGVVDRDHLGAGFISGAGRLQASFEKIN